MLAVSKPGGPLSLPHYLRDCNTGDIVTVELEIELAESALVQNQGKTIQALQQLKELGIRIVLDDFATGYFSLYHLRHYPLDALEIDVFDPLKIKGRAPPHGKP